MCLCHDSASLYTSTTLLQQAYNKPIHHDSLVLWVKSARFGQSANFGQRACVFHILILEKKHRRRSRWATSQIPMLKFLTAQHPQIRPLSHDSGDRMKMPLDMFYIFNVCKRTKFGIKIFIIDSVSKI